MPVSDHSSSTMLTLRRHSFEHFLQPNQLRALDASVFAGYNQNRQLTFSSVGGSALVMTASRTR
jgi:hypothetical protein